MSPARTNVVLCVGELPERAATALLDAGMSIRICKDAYDVAIALADGKDSVCALHVASEALSSRVLSLMRLLRDRRRGVALWVTAGSLQASMATALSALGATTPEGILAGFSDVGSPTVAPPAAHRPEPTPDHTAKRPPAQQATHPSAPLRRNSEEAIVVRTPVKEADNATSDNPAINGKNIERDSASRYDGLTGQPLLSEDELRALLDPSDDTPSA